MFEIARYQAADKAQWNEFVAQSKNGTFLLDRNYMDYHADRFADHSFLFYLKGKLYALLPANVVDKTLYSHQGLTYGGLIVGQQVTAANTLVLMQELNGYLQAEGIERVVYKAIPWIYQRIPAEEDLYALIKVCSARLIARDISSTVNLKQPPKFMELRRRGVKKALKNGLEVRETDDLEAFWDILNSNLQAKYGAVPVHSKAELRLLAHRFPDNIKLYAAFKDNVMLGGTVVFITPQVVHTQYISASPEGKKEGALDLVFSYLIHEKYADACYFDFGKSTEDRGTVLNEPLIFQKEGFGGRGVCYDWYEWTV